MKILFICASLEPGKDGVGDYTRTIAAELSKRGHLVKLLAVRDKHTDIILESNWVPPGQQAPLSELRLPANGKTVKHRAVLKHLLREFAPDWVSIQYVGYSFNKRGMPFAFINALRRLRIQAKVHIMFHEIWQGESKDSTVKDKVIGYFQKRSAKMLVTHLKANRTSTSNAFYKRCLEKAGISSDTIPVFSNIPEGSTCGGGIYEQLSGTCLGKAGNYLLACFFGGFHNHDQLVPRIRKLAAEIKLQLNKDLIITHVGISRGIDKAFALLREETGVTMIALGQHGEKDIADFLRKCDLGLSNYPKILYEKSGSTAAMLHNGCPVVILKDSFESDNRSVSEIEEFVSITNIREFVTQSTGFSKRYGVADTADKYDHLFT
jgi:hypothetical protein